nr:transcription factor ces-2-like [Cherax quadricarinatus]
MEMSVLHETLQHQQQMALAARALLGTLASPEVPPPLLSFSHRLQPEKVGGSTSLMVRALASTTPRRPRGEKKPIPETLKDDKYYERRKRNNLAAKKSRDARKQREDQVAIRASILEKENAILRAQVATLRDEAASLRQLLFQKKTRRQ